MCSAGYLNGLLPESWHCVSEPTGHVREDLIGHCGRLEVVNEVFQLRGSVEEGEGGGGDRRGGEGEGVKGGEAVYGGIQKVRIGGKGRRWFLVL